MSFDTMRADVDHLTKLGELAYVVVDEAQRIKNRLSLAFIALSSLPADFRLLLTGTPVNNNLAELFTLLSFIAPNLIVSPVLPSVNVSARLLACCMLWAARRRQEEERLVADAGTVARRMSTRGSRSSRSRHSRTARSTTRPRSARSCRASRCAV